MNAKRCVGKGVKRMNDQIPYTDEKRAIERWENEGGRCVGPF